METLIFPGADIPIALGGNSPDNLERPTAEAPGALLMLAPGTLTRARSGFVHFLRTGVPVTLATTAIAVRMLSLCPPPGRA